MKKKQFSKNSSYLIEKLKIFLEKRFSYLFSNGMEELFLAITYLDVRFKNFYRGSIHKRRKVKYC